MKGQDGPHYLTQARSWPVVLIAWLVAIAAIAVGYVTRSSQVILIGWTLLALDVIATLARAALIVTRRGQAKGLVDARTSVRDYARNLIESLLP